MLSSKLINYINYLSRKNNIISLIVAILILSTIIFLSYRESGFQTWMWSFLLILPVGILSKNSSDSTVKLLENDARSISHIVIDRDNSQIEIEFHIKEKNYRRSLKLPYKDGLVVASMLMEELPDMKFYDDRGEILTDLSKIEN